MLNTERYDSESLLAKLRNNRVKNSAWLNLMKRYTPKANDADNDEREVRTHTMHTISVLEKDCSNVFR